MYKSKYDNIYILLPSSPFFKLGVVVAAVCILISTRKNKAFQYYGTCTCNNLVAKEEGQKKLRGF